MVDLDIVSAKIASASARLADVDELLARSQEEFLADVRGRDLTAFYVQLVVQDCIDLASHWVSESGWPPPDDAGSAFDALADHDIIPRELATTMRAAAKLRNRIAHGYASVDLGRFYDEILEGRDSLKRFLAAVVDAADL